MLFSSFSFVYISLLRPWATISIPFVYFFSSLLYGHCHDSLLDSSDVCLMNSPCTFPYAILLFYILLSFPCMFQGLHIPLFIFYFSYILSHSSWVTSRYWPSTLFLMFTLSSTLISTFFGSKAYPHLLRVRYLIYCHYFLVLQAMFWSLIFSSHLCLHFILWLVLSRSLLLSRYFLLLSFIWAQLWFSYISLTFLWFLGIIWCFFNVCDNVVFRYLYLFNSS